jgi:phosphohistidine swiveling domain-containing protein
LSTAPAILDDPLHTESGPNTTWTTVNTAEALPGVQTPLSWTWWSDAIELGMRRCFCELGVLRPDEVMLPASADQRYSVVFFGRYSANINQMRAVGDRMLGTDADAVEEQLLGGLHSGLRNQNTLSRAPAIARKVPVLIYRLPKILAQRREETNVWWRHNTSPGVLSDTEGAPDRLIEARQRFIDVMEPHAAASMLCQAMYDQVVGVAAAAGVAGLETSLVTGYGDFEEGRIAEHVWEVSRGRMTIEQFVADHGYHGPHEGALSSRSWREDPTPIEKLVATYRSMDESATPSNIEAARVQERRAAEAKLLAATPAIRRGTTRLVLRLAKRQIPLREIGKAAFLQAIDVARAASRTLGDDLTARGLIDDPDDVQYVTFEEIRTRDFTDLRGRVAARRAKREEYLQIRLPDTWTGPPDAVAIREANAEQLDEITGIAVAPGLVEARARVVTDPEAGIEIEPGEILVCETTDPSWASYFLVASALVIDIGGAISHGAIVARELGVPCVINTRVGTRQIQTGDLLRVDGDTGEVRILERAAAS